jgi:hypothetical protein
MGGSAPPPPLANNLGGSMGGDNESICSHSHSSSLLLMCNSVPSRSMTAPCAAPALATCCLLSPGMFLTQVSKVVLCISPLAGSVRRGIIYLGTDEHHQDDAITAYFKSTGHDILVMPCSNFEVFMAEKPPVPP